MNQELEVIELSPAERLYQRHLTYVKSYQKANKEKVAEKCKAYIERIKTERPEHYEAMKQKRKDYYQNVVKPKKESLSVEGKVSKL
jgi:hypothetical protein